MSYTKLQEECKFEVLNDLTIALFAGGVSMKVIPKVYNIVKAIDLPCDQYKELVQYVAQMANPDNATLIKQLAVYNKIKSKIHGR